MSQTIDERLAIQFYENNEFEKAESVFKTIIVDNQDNIVASNLEDTLTLKPGTNMTIQTNENSKTITFASSNGTNTQDLYKTIRVDGHNDLIPNTSTDILKFVGANNIDNFIYLNIFKYI